MIVDKRDRVNIFGVLLDRVDYCEACRRVEFFLQANNSRIIITPNAEIIMSAKQDRELKAALNKADLCFPDGIGVTLAAKILGKPLTGRTTGFDFMMKILNIADIKRLKLFLLGGKPGVAEKAGEKIKEMYPNAEIVGVHHGYFNEDKETKIIESINEKKPDILLVAMGCPKQELFMMRNKEKLQFKVAMGVGGSLDVLSGTVLRAPVFMQKAGLEWLYRLTTQPSRFNRMKVLPLFLIEVIWHRILYGCNYKNLRTNIKR